MTLHRKTGDVKRPYDAPRRAERARATRTEILTAAKQLFLAKGYAATSVKSVAEAASVSEQTVYNAFGDKATLLLAVGEQVLRAEDSEGWIARMRAEPDPIRRIELVASWSRDLWEHGLLELEAMLLEAGSVDARLAEVAEHARQSKLQMHRSLSAILFPDEIRRPDVTLDEVAGLTMAIDSAAVVRTLVSHLGWTFETYERWLVEILVRTFLAPTAWQ